MSGLACSVVIPSHNRRASLELMLGALSRQTLSADRFEAIIILDGPTDDSAELLEQWKQSGSLPNLRYAAQAQAGQAAARTAGAKLAGSAVLVFLDDDVIPEPGCLEAHVRRHAGAGDAVAVLGDAPIVLPPKPSLYDTLVWAWWEDTYAQRAKPGRVSSYRDFCAGNVSLRKEDFFRVGGFDPDFAGYGGEDFDLGYRLLRAGVCFAVEPAALARHHHVSTAERVLRNVRQEGRHDMLLARKHPELLRGLRIMQRPQQARSIFERRAIIDFGAALARLWLPVLEKTGFRGSWRRLFGKLRHHAYWCGVRDVLEIWGRVEDLWNTVPPIPETEIDVKQGLPREPGLWVEGPVRVRFRLGDLNLGVLHLAEPTDEPVAELLAERFPDLGASAWLSLIQQGINPWRISKKTT